MSKRSQPERLPSAELVRRPESPNWYIEWYDPKRRRLRRRSTGTVDRAEAEIARARFLLGADSAAKADPEGGSKASDPRELTIDVALDHYWEQHAFGLPSAEQARIAIGHLKRHFGRCAVADLADIGRQQSYVNARHGHGVRASTISRELSVLRAGIRYYESKHPGAPAPRILDLDALEPRGRWLTVEEANRLIHAARSRHVYLFIQLMLATAARPEAISICAGTRSTSTRA